MPDEQGQQQGNGNQGQSGQPGGASADPPRSSSDLDWRARALKAEARAEQLETLAAELAQKLEAAQTRLAAVERKHQVEKALSDHGAIDLETASMLIDTALSAPSQGAAPDISGLVADLRRRKPYLFVGTARASAMSGIPGVPAGDALEAAAEEARATGDRSALLRYLRLKRDH